MFVLFLFCCIHIWKLLSCLPWVFSKLNNADCSPFFLKGSLGADLKPVHVFSWFLFCSFTCAWDQNTCFLEFVHNLCNPHIWLDQDIYDLPSLKLFAWTSVFFSLSGCATYRAVSFKGYICIISREYGKLHNFGWLQTTDSLTSTVILIASFWVLP